MLNHDDTAERDRAATIEEARRLAHDASATARGADPAYPLSVYDRALAMLSPLGPNEALADVMRWKGNILRDCGDHARAMDLYAQSLSVADVLSYQLGRAHALNCFGTMAQVRGDLDSAVTWYRAAQQLARGLSDTRLSGLIEMNLGVAMATSDRPQDAIRHLRDARDAFERSADHQCLLWVLNNLGNLYTREREYDQASATLHSALELARVEMDSASEGIVEENLASLLLATGKIDEADDAAQHALEIATKRRDATRQASALCVMARVLRHRERRSPELRPVLDRALELCDTGHDAELKSEILSEIATAFDDRGERERATAFRQAADDLERPLTRFDETTLS
jgi:tetratricopeptide (TPR) repeat protein